MPLIPIILRNELAALMDPANAHFKGFPDTKAGVADNWAGAIHAYAQNMIIQSSTAAPARLAMRTVMMEVDNNIGNGFEVIGRAIHTYAGVYAGGMVTSGYSGTPPVAPPHLEPLLAITGDVSVRIDYIVAIIDIWFRTGTAVNLQTSAIIPWS